MPPKSRAKKANAKVAARKQPFSAPVTPRRADGALSNDNAADTPITGPVHVDRPESSSIAAARLSALKGKGHAEETVNKQESLRKPEMPESMSPDAEADMEFPEEEEDVDADGSGYLSDDSDEGADPVMAGLVAAHICYTLTLLIPDKHIEEVPRTMESVMAHLVHWKKELSADAPATTKFQKLQPTYLSKERFGRVQVTFVHEKDAAFVWKRAVAHDCLNGTSLKLTWHFPENADYVRARSLHPNAFEVVLKGVPAELTPERIRKFLVIVWLVKRGKTPFKEGYGFHRVQDPVLGMDTDKILGLLIQHENDLYRWRHFIVDPAMNGKKLLLHFPSLNCDYCNGHHMTRYHDDYVTDRQANIIKAEAAAVVDPGGAAGGVAVLRDLNIVADPIMDKTSRQGSDAENRRLLHICSKWDLRDVFRTLYPSRLEYTFLARPTLSSSRIDRALASSSMLPLVADAYHSASPPDVTDHWFGITTVLTAQTREAQGPGLWRMHADQTKHPGVRNTIRQVLSEQGGTGKPDLHSTLAGLQASLKAHAREERKRIGKTIAHLEDRVAALRQKFMADSSQGGKYAELTKYEAQLKAYRDSQRRRKQTMAGIGAEMNGEIANKFLTQRIASRKAKTAIKEIVHDGKKYEGEREVLTAASDFYAKLFGAKQQVAELEEWPMDPTKTLSAEARQGLIAPWTEKEVRRAMRELPRGKAPGADGLPKELLEDNWDLLGESVMDFMRGFEKTAELPRSASTAVTILLHKKGERTDLGNYRPITLLNATYKIAAKLLANRMKGVLSQVISENQFGFVSGRRLADAVKVVADTIDAAVTGKEDWYLLLVDFQKAYDSVLRAFMFRTLERMGFPKAFVEWTKGLHDHAATQLLVNGWLGERVEVESGVRQGCPLAPYLFICAAEPLSQEAERRRLGLRKRGKGGLAYLGYADDTTLLLRGKEQLKKAQSLLEDFSDRSGLHVNRGKSTVMPLGRNRTGKPPADVHYNWAERGTPERLLGIWITTDGRAEPTWEKALPKGEGEQPSAVESGSGVVRREPDETVAARQSGKYATGLGDIAGTQGNTSGMDVWERALEITYTTRVGQAAAGAAGTCKPLGDGAGAALVQPLDTLPGEQPFWQAERLRMPEGVDGG
ncbi:unnamed protein product [Closterium sp. NIES-65]|nr:unnamed protein product [Closterium sp. NIES-65]